MNSKPLHKGETITLKIDNLAFGGQGIGRYQDRVVFIDQALPGQTIHAKIIKIKKNYAEAILQDVIHQSPHYQQPPCIHFGSCGGCSFQHLSYQQQLYHKEQQVYESLQRIGGFKHIPMHPIIASPQIFAYRNKMEFSFSPYRWLSQEELDREANDDTALYLGLHAKRFYQKVVDVTRCHLVTEKANEIMCKTREFTRKTQWPAYDVKHHSGFWRFLVVRCSSNTADIMVNLVAFDYQENLAKEFRELMISTFPEITSLLFSTTQNKSGVAIGEREYLLHGNPFIEEKLADYRFLISSTSFFQTNTLQTENLYKIVAEFAEIQPHEIVYDLFCGAGTIAIFLSSFAQRIIGFELIAPAVADANKNAQINGIDNCEFITSDLKNLAADSRKVIELHGRPSVLVIDPPRSGMHPKTIATILSMQPKRIVHVSCNPTTLARDLKILCQEKYKLVAVQPVDMFPHTHHIETVAKLVLK